MMSRMSVDVARDKLPLYSQSSGDKESQLLGLRIQQSAGCRIISFRSAIRYDDAAKSVV